MKKKALLGILALIMAYTAYAYDNEKDFTAVLMEDGRSVEIRRYLGNKKTVNIPPRINNLPVTRIGDSAFYNLKITKITIPRGVTTIGWSAFQNCESLTDITIPSGVTTIETDAFAYCTKLKNITIPSSVTAIGDTAFKECKSIKKIIIPSGVTTIGYWTFNRCTSLVSINVPSSVTSIGERAFADCKSLTSITIPASVKKIDDEVFLNWTSSQTINIEGHANQQSADRTFGKNWLDGCKAQINYRG